MEAERYDQCAMARALRGLPGADPEWIISAIERELSLTEAKDDLIRHLAARLTPATERVDPDADTILEHHPSCSESDTAVL